jgi:hypothetical protein
MPNRWSSRYRLGEAWVGAFGLSYRAGLAGNGAFTSRSRSTLRTSKLIHKTASATPNKNAASTNHGH